MRVKKNFSTGEKFAIKGNTPTHTPTQDPPPLTIDVCHRFYLLKK